MPEKNSLFYDELTQRFTVPLLAIEHYALKTSSAEADEDFLRVLTEVLVQTCKVLEPVEDDYSYLISRFQEISQTMPLNAPEEAPKRQGKSFGTSLVNYLNNLDAISMLGAMTHYDIDKMRQLYCHTDFTHVRQFMKSYTEGLMEMSGVALEACLYGSGNSYKDDSTRGNVIDADSKEGAAMLRAYGIGDVSGDMLGQLGLGDLGITLE